LVAAKANALGDFLRARREQLRPDADDRGRPLLGRAGGQPVARALCPGFAPGQNFLRWRLLDPAARELYMDWDEATDVAVGGLREAAGTNPYDPRLQSLID
jgi:hypothetical protein